MSFTGDMLVHTLRGDVPVAGLLHRTDPTYVFTWDGKQITVGRIRVVPAGVKLTKRLVLDSGRSLRVSTDQLVLAQPDGQPVSPCSENLSVLPLYLGKTTNGYPTYKQQGENWRNADAPCDRRRVRLVARMVYEWKGKATIKTGTIVRTIDGDVTNCHPENLRLEGRPKQGRRRLANYLKVQEEVRRLEAQSKPTPPPPPPPEKPEKPKKKGGPNHRIVNWEEWEEEDTFDLIGVECSNLAVGEIFCAVTNGSA